MADAYIRPATIEDAICVALNVREADRLEIWASDQLTPVAALVRAYNRSAACFCLVVDGEIACIYGVAPLSTLTGTASPWMIGTDLIKKNQFTFLRKCKKSVLDMVRPYSTLTNYVDSRNKLSIRWLKWLGFNVNARPEPYGAMGMLFHRFELRK